MILGKAIILNSAECRGEDGMIKDGVRMTITEKLLSTVVDITWAKQVVNGVEPVIRVMSEPRRLLVDLHYREVGEPYQALEWKANSFNLSMFRLNAEEAFKQALITWAKRDHNKVYWASDSVVRQSTDSEFSSGIALVSGRRN